MRLIDADSLKKRIEGMLELIPKESLFTVATYSVLFLVYEQPTISLESKQATSNWILVSERLPQDGEPILVTVATDNGNKLVYPTYGGETIRENKELHIAWMPLPEPYKESDDE